MSLGIYPVLDPPVREAKFDYVGEVLAMQFETLDQLAVENDFTPLTAFTDTREIPEGFDGSPDELEDAMGPWEDWFSCRDGILAVEVLARLLDENPSAARRLQSPEAVIAELRAMAGVLAIGEENGSRFRLQMG